MLKPRVGDIIRQYGRATFERVVGISSDGSYSVTVLGGIQHHVFISNILEVIRPARIKPRMTRKEAREWHRKQACWELSRTQENYCASCDGDGVKRCAYGKTEVAAVRALMAKMGVKR